MICNFLKSGFPGGPNQCPDGLYYPNPGWNSIPRSRKVREEYPRTVRNQEKGVLAKGVSAESSVAPKETKNTQKYWAQQCIWHSERHSQERRTLLQTTPSKTPFSWFLRLSKYSRRTFPEMNSGEPHPKKLRGLFCGTCL